MAMDIFGRNPSSFKLNKNSVFASTLKAFVADKLKHFLLNYTDDVLAEYITVLVCNGKDQYQARDELEAFLGERNEEFVSWLWNLLLKSVHHSHVRKPKLRMSRGLHNHDKGRAKMLSNDEKDNYHATFAPSPVSSNDNEVSEGSQRLSPGYDTCMDEIYETKGKPKSLKDETRKRSVPYEDYYGKVLKYGPSRVKVSSGTSARDDQNIHVDQNKKLHKEQEGRYYCKGLPRQCLYSQKKELPPRKFDSVAREHLNNEPSAVTSVSQRSASSKPADSMSHQNARPRGTVWDRLGKPHEDKQTVRGKDVDVHGVDVIKRVVVEHPGEVHDQNRLVVFVPGGRLRGRLKGEIPTFDNSSGPVISETHDDDDECKREEHDLNTMCIPHHTDKPIKKRHFSEIDSDIPIKKRHLHDRENLKEVQKSSSAKHSCSETLNSVSSSGARQTAGVQTCQTFVLLDNDFFPGPNKVSPRKLRGKVSDIPQTLGFNRLVSKAGEDKIEDSEKNNLKPVQAKMLDVKLKLHQIEMEMAELKANQLESNEDKPHLLSSSGPLTHSDEDVVSRTVFVTNVHFGATKEALSSHFDICGDIVKVVILNDAVTAQPKGAAYITFHDKDSADKAIALSGTSFWSRTLQVVSKAELRAQTSAPPQPLRRPSWPQSLQPRRIPFYPRQRATSLQWRRDQPVSAEHSISGPELGLETSETVEQNGNGSGDQQLKNSLENRITAKEEEVLKDRSTAKEDEEYMETT
ncbi:RNA binding (RRM/RBD/RNP motifs) family protein [Thalictrum thalictroides]|uniref:RNA binding (RRM/RBD/RNP motifs) family protein n=1 Tax=Thalictrum thalictroides TaxID=46969 RepID=A0A7J6VA09_THATH|nr:RNA binding (RRM/RBD/RNP motifs) family protein [Thalictrum thalictroides]